MGIVHNLSFPAEPPPLTTNIDGVVLVGQTRVTLDTVITVFENGATAEEIVYRYPSLRLADVYGAIAYYLNHQEEVQSHRLNYQQHAQTVRQQNEAKPESQTLRERLLARKYQQQVC